MRISIVNCVSTAAEMMRFSDYSLFANAGHHSFDYVVVKWLASPEVEEYLSQLPGIINSIAPGLGIELVVVEHQTDESVGYVPNLRAMMNRGFEEGFRLNQYCGLVNTDCYFGPRWLKNLVKHLHPGRVVNSIHITAATPPRPVRGIVTENLGAPTQETFDRHGFARAYDRLCEPGGLYVAPVEDHRQAATMPYLFHRNYWESCGPWELTLEKGTPDMRFFQRVADAGAEFALARDSIVYHHEKVERSGARPCGAEHLPEE